VTQGEVLAALEACASPAAVADFRMLQTRYEVSGQLAPDSVLCAPVACPDGRYMAVLFSLRPHQASGGSQSWETVWHSVEGPMSRQELEDLGRSLKAREG
jgi:hypothetical protein